MDESFNLIMTRIMCSCAKHDEIAPLRVVGVEMTRHMRCDSIVKSPDIGTRLVRSSVTNEMKIVTIYIFYCI